MRPAHLLLLTGLAGLAGCGPAGEERTDRSAESLRPRDAPAATRGRVIDTADMLTDAEEQSVAGRLARLEARSGRKVTLVTIRPTDGDSMERIGWAVGGASGAGPLLMLVDADRRAIRIEGDLAPERKAAVAGAMQPGLRGEDLPSAVEAAAKVLEAAGA